MAGVSLHSCFCAVIKRVFWTGHTAGVGCTPSVTAEGSVRDDPKDHGEGKRYPKPLFCELPRADIIPSHLSVGTVFNALCI